jgi:hypothetical protein
MKIEVQLTEVMAFLKNFNNANIGLKYIEEGKIEVKYLISADLTIKDLSNDVVTIGYKANGVVDLLAMGVNFFLGRKLDKMPFEWKPKESEVIINLKDIEAFKNFLKYFYVTDILFVEDYIIVLLSTRLTIENN